MSNLTSNAAVRGRPFSKGNPGRKPGSQNRATLLASELLDEKREQRVQKAIEMALNGDSQMIKFLLGRILPRERTVELTIAAFDSADDAVEVTSPARP